MRFPLMTAIPASEICFLSARALTKLLRERELGVTELMHAVLAQIDRVNPQVNAICTLVRDQALGAAEHADERLLAGEPPGALFGLPMAIKDLVLTRGIRTTFGSPIHKDFVPEQDELFVARLREAGAIIIGKTNTPEFGAGSQTFNEVFGATRNPHALDRTCGGSSGGAATALACGMVALADGSDLGGSLRNPASFCNVVGFRTSPGRVPTWPNVLGWNSLPVLGPMARNVADAALLLSVMAGPDPRSPISIDEPGEKFLRPLERTFKGTHIAWTPDLGKYPVAPEVIEVCSSALPIFEELGCEVTATEPDVSGADEVFQILRAWGVATGLRADYEANRALIKDTVVWNIERGLELTGTDVARAEATRTAIYHRVREFLEDYEYLLLPAAQVAPFDINIPWISEINGTPLESYIDWMAVCYVITITGLPAISVPCGFTDSGLPIGMQIVGRHHHDFEVLQLAHAFEQATGYAQRRPEVAC